MVIMLRFYTRIGANCSNYTYCLADSDNEMQIFMKSDSSNLGKYLRNNGKRKKEESK